MTKEQVKKWRPEIIYWVNGGNLWIRSNENWLKCDNDDLVFERDIYVIEDKHFEARKAFALGEPVEVNLTLHGITPWASVEFPLWDDTHNYRPKTKIEEIDLDDALSEALGRQVRVIQYQT